MINVKEYIENRIKQLKPVERFSIPLLKELRHILDIINQNIEEAKAKRNATIVDKLKPWSTALAKIVEKDLKEKS